MKAIVTILILFITSSLFAQTTEWKKCGLDNNPTLNEFEAKYFNEVFFERRGEFDLQIRKLCFSKVQQELQNQRNRIISILSKTQMMKIFMHGKLVEHNY